MKRKFTIVTEEGGGRALKFEGKHGINHVLPFDEFGEMLYLSEDLRREAASWRRSVLKGGTNHD